MSHLPPPNFDPVAEYLTSIEIDASIEKVWAILVDIASYPEWNPYLRSAVMVDPSTHTPLADPTLRPGTLVLAMQSPPTLHPAKKTPVYYETVSLVDPSAHRLTWGGGRLPSVFRAEHAHALSTTPEGKTRYEARHVFGGLSGYVIKRTMGAGLKSCGQAMADALKERGERE